MFLAFILVIGMPLSAFADSDSDTLETPHGKLTGTLKGTGGWVNSHGFKGTTKLSETAVKLYVKVDVRDYLTGKLEDSDSKTETSTKSVSVTVYGNDKDRKKTGYGTHEVTDTKSYAVYTTTTQG